MSDKKIVFTGSRNYYLPTLVEHALKMMDAKHLVAIVGDAEGMDSAVDDWLNRSGVIHCSEIKIFSADWKTHGKAAGPIRNNQMLDENPDLVIAFPAKGSKGTKHCYEEAIRRGIPTLVIRCDQ